MINPYTFYCIGFLVAPTVYVLGWSEAYPKLTLVLTVFILATVIIHAAFAFYWSARKKIIFSKTSPVISPVIITVLLYILWTINFIYEGGIPLFKILFNEPFDYRLFGMPSLHVLAVTFSSFYTVYLFHVFLSERRNLILVLYLINLFAAVLIYSRSMLFFNLTSSFFLYLFSVKRIHLRSVVLAVPVILMLFYLFGVAGNKRVAFEAHQPYSSSTFLNVGKASASFQESSIPEEFFWAYVYISSPLGNLQANINHAPAPPITISRVFEFLNNEVLFESISKRINGVLGIERADEVIFKPPFNVSTTYSRSYSYLGWPGMITMAFIILVIPLVYNQLLSKDNPYSLTAHAILCTTFLFLVYDNTIRLMALGFQLVYPLFFPFVDRLYKKYATA